MYDGYSKYDAAQAFSYDSDRKAEEHWTLENLYIEGRLGGFVGRRLLDVPVGTGRFLPVYRGVELVVGADVSPHMLNCSAMRVVEYKIVNVVLSAGSVLSLPFVDDSFDVSVCCRLLHLMPKSLIAPVMKELARVTRGEIVLQVYAKGDFLKRLTARLCRLPANISRRINPRARPEKPWSGIQSHFHAQADIEAACDAASLMIVERDHLCDYDGHRVMFYVIVRK